MAVLAHAGEAGLRARRGGGLGAHKGPPPQESEQVVAGWMREDGLQDVEVLGELGPGERPAVVGRLPGRTSQEILIIAPMGEAGAIDDAFGVIVALGIGRMLAAATRGTWRPERGARFLFTAESRSLTTLLRLQPRLFKCAALGLTLIPATGERDGSGAVLAIMPNPPPSFDPCLPALLHSLAAFPELRWGMGPADGGHALDDPLLGIPTTRLLLASSGSSPGRKGRLESQLAAATGRIGRWLGGHVTYLCSARPAEIADMARLGVRYARRRLAEAARTARRGSGEPAALRYRAEQERRRLTGLLRLIPADEPIWVDDACPALPPVDARGLSPAAAARALIERLVGRIVPPAVRQARGGAATPADPWEVMAARRVPLKVFKGVLDAGSLTPEVRRRLSRVTGVNLDREAHCWPGSSHSGSRDEDGRAEKPAPTARNRSKPVAAGVPPAGFAGQHENCCCWLQWALGWSNGKRALSQIGDFLRHEGCGVPCERLVRAFALLERNGFVRWRPYLTGRDLDRALRRVGVKPGMLVVTHSSLSAFGYVEGGALTVIDRLQAAVGAGGTLAMPTHTVSTFGRPAYDAARTPSTVGSITDVFRQLDDVRRSPHPTHSVAVRGPLADALTAGHTGDLAPHAREGFWGRFIDNDGWVLMMAPLRKNTLMHAAELWSGVTLPGMVLAGRPGRRGGPRVIPTSPWHNNWFDLAHEQMRTRGLIASAPLGEGTIYLMRGRDVVDAGLAVLRNDPLRVTKQNCRCEWCEIVRRRNDMRMML